MRKRLAIIICLATLFISLSIGGYVYAKTPVAYMSLDINPSVELGINPFGQVVKVEGYNNDGKKILYGVNVTGSNVTEAVSALVISAANNGFIAKDGSTVISLTSETDNASTATKLESEAKTGASGALKENGKNAIIYESNVALALREKAKTLGITAGKLNLINKLKAVDPTATVDEYKDAKVTEIMTDIQKENTAKSGVNNTGESSVGSKPESESSVGSKPESESSVGSKPESESSVGSKPESESSVGSKPESESSVGSKPIEQVNKDNSTKSVEKSSNSNDEKSSDSNDEGKDDN